MEKWRKTVVTIFRFLFNNNYQACYKLQPVAHRVLFIALQIHASLGIRSRHLFHFLTPAQLVLMWIYSWAEDNILLMRWVDRRVYVAPQL